VVTLPAVLLLLDEWPLGRLRRRDAPERWDPGRIGRAVREKLPLVALVVAAGVVTVVAQRAGGAVASLEQVPFPLRASNAVVATVAYLGKAFWPTGLAIFYPHPGNALSGWQVAFSAALLLAVTALLLALARRHPYGLVGWLWYLATLAPVIGLVQVGSQAMADRYMYLPLIGLSIVVAWGVPDLMGKGRRRRLVLAATASAAIAALTAGTALQLRHWRDSEALFAHALSVTRDNHVANAYLGSALLQQGRTREAIALYSEAVRLRPDFLTAANNLAWLLATAEAESLRNPYAALRLAQRSARLTQHSDAHVLDTLAAAYAAAGRFEEAVLTAERGVGLARESGDVELEAEIEGRLARYRAGQAHREDPTGP
jgi:tetratricopeptide (TPR) repeat protein